MTDLSSFGSMTCQEITPLGKFASCIAIDFGSPPISTTASTSEVFTAPRWQMRRSVSAQKLTLPITVWSYQMQTCNGRSAATTSSKCLTPMIPSAWLQRDVLLFLRTYVGWRPKPESPVISLCVEPTKRFIFLCSRRIMNCLILTTASTLLSYPIGDGTVRSLDSHLASSKAPKSTLHARVTSLREATHIALST